MGMQQRRWLICSLINLRSMKKLQLEQNQFCRRLKCCSFLPFQFISRKCYRHRQIYDQDRKVDANIKQALLKRIKPLFWHGKDKIRLEIGRTNLARNLERTNLARNLERKLSQKSEDKLAENLTQLLHPTR